MTTLFVLAGAWDEAPSLLASLRSELADGKAIVLALDFWAGRKLREAGIPYETPRAYLDVGGFRDLDLLAARLARSWYEALGDRLDHHGIPLGQMAELDFGFLFIDALRSVEIARSVFAKTNPDKVFLYPPSPDEPSRRPNTICHESLPPVVDYLARRRRVPVTWVGPSFTSRAEGGQGDRGARSRPRLRRFLPGIHDVLLRAFEVARTLLLSATGRGRRTVLFMQVSASPRIAATTDTDGIRWANIAPVRTGLLKAGPRAAEIRGLWQELQRDSAFIDALTYREVPLSEVLARRFEEFFQQGVPSLIEHLEGAEWLLRRLKPQMLVVLEDVSPVSRILSRVFKRGNVPVLVIQHGAVSVDMGGLVVMPLEADRQAVWGELLRDWHVKRGRTADSQAITGSPGLDPIAKSFNPDEEGVLRRLHLERDRGVILVATEWFTGISTAATVEDEEKFIRNTLRALNELSGYQVVVKLHPNYQAAYERLVRTIAEEEGVGVSIAKEGLWDLLAMADLAVVSNSTVGIEAMILGKPVVMVDAYEGVEKIPYVTSGAALGASRPAEIASAARKALHDRAARKEMDRSRDQFVRQYAHLQDGQASERVARLILDMMEGQADA